VPSDSLDSPTTVTSSSSSDADEPGDLHAITVTSSDGSNSAGAVSGADVVRSASAAVGPSATAQGGQAPGDTPGVSPGDTSETVTGTSQLRSAISLGEPELTVVVTDGKGTRLKRSVQMLSNQSTSSRSSYDWY
jgi:hypothetical protein